ncbi:major facilitator superfamily domain-containing protein [Aspergillus keveii]|uniref:Major facilitator superfamily domain-containing protein n=1 Tax=Aspergillus keveii TaxID=714993 RepID=A0ABR4FUS7_9EURO
MTYGTVTANPNPHDAENPHNVANEEQPLLSPSPIPDADPDSWKPPRGFLWIEVAIFANVFLSGFDGTITASTYALISSEFNAANTSSWLTTSYLITSTAFQPLYGRFSDIFGRRACFFTSTVTFLLGCLGCAVARNVIFLNLMRALTGIGGGGLMTMATIINSDMIPFQRRGMYQAAQNVLHGFGSICGASLGGSIANTIGWRWCFLLQVPVSIFALFVGRVVIPKRQKPDVDGTTEAKTSVWKQVDLTGALLLILGLSVQLVGLSLGGNELPWSNGWVIASLVGSVVLLGLFFLVEARTSAIPVIPLRMLQGVLPVSTQIANICVGMAAYAFLFNLPLFFQIVLLDSASKAGARLVIPSLATPIGGLLSGIIMSRYGKLSYLMRTGATLMFLGNLLVMALQFSDSEWKYFVYVIPANLGQGVVYPAILFTFLAAFGHDDHAVSASTVYLIRSLGTVYGVAITSTIVQNHLVRALPDALHGVPDKWKVIDSIRHSVSAIYDLEPEIQLAARQVYYQGIKMAFGASAAFGGVAALAAMFARGRGLKRAGES